VKVLNHKYKYITFVQKYLSISTSTKVFCPVTAAAAAYYTKINVGLMKDISLDKKTTYVSTNLDSMYHTRMVNSSGKTEAC